VYVFQEGNTEWRVIKWILVRSHVIEIHRRQLEIDLPLQEVLAVLEMAVGLELLFLGVPTSNSAIYESSEHDHVLLNDAIER
jgi:hypothetical protein